MTFNAITHEWKIQLGQLLYIMTRRTKEFAAFSLIPHSYMKKMENSNSKKWKMVDST